MRLSARILGLFFAFIVLLFVSKTSFAQENSTVKTYTPPSSAQVKMFTQNVFFEILSISGCQLSGYDPIDKNSACEGLGKSGGAIGTVGNMITALYTPPLHTNDYFKYLSSNFGIAKSAEAQTAGIGLQQLSPLIPIWKVFRNLVYLLFVIILAFIGIAIMLRVKVDPRTIMTVQNQIPKIIIGLALVTLSLAIAGFLIDIMWVSTYMVISVVGQADPSVPRLINGQLYNNPLGFVNILLGPQNINWNAAGAISDVVTQTLNPQFSTTKPPSSCDTGGIPLLCNIGDIFASTLGAVLNGVWAWLVGTIVGVIAFFIISIAILWSLIKLWFALLKAYIMILVHTALAPFWILAGLLPNPSGDRQSLGFGNWVREMLGNLMAFPAVIGLFMLGKIFSSSFGGNINLSDPNALNASFIPPLLGGVSGNSEIGALIGLGFILASPRIVDITKKAFKQNHQSGQDRTFGESGQGASILGGALLGRMMYRDRMGSLQGPIGGFLQTRLENSDRRTARVAKTVLKINKTDSGRSSGPTGGGTTSGGPTTG